MKTVESIKKTLTLKASKEKVWEVLTKDEYTRQWYKEFAEGTHAVSDWKEGSKIAFLDQKGEGLIAVISVFKPTESLEFTYTGIVSNGQEDLESKNATALKGFKETYSLQEKNGVTLLNIESEMSEEFVQMMEESWNRALKVFEELAEKK